MSREEETNITQIQRLQWYLLSSRITYLIFNILVILWVLFYGSIINAYTLLLLAAFSLSICSHATHVCMSHRTHTQYVSMSAVLIVWKGALLIWASVLYTNAQLAITTLWFLGINITFHLTYDIVVGLVKNTIYEYDVQPYLPYDCEQVYDVV